MYNFRYNTVKSYTEIEENGSWKQLDDRRFNSIYQQHKKDGGKTTEANLRSLLNSDFVPEYDPIKEYFTGLPALPSKNDYIEELASEVKTTDQAYWELCLRK
ncbi:hypothetical protein [Gracilimonas sp.]|uniref:hypothetical protein n=1 Tax=Gracilimonas sp. TaxID=1974203 RepID=UPI0032EF1015